MCGSDLSEGRAPRRSCGRLRGEPAGIGRSGGTGEGAQARHARCGRERRDDEMACAGTGPLTATSQRGMDGCVEHGGPASSVAHFSFRSRCLVHGYSMSLAIMGLWHVASTQQHSAYCMLRSIDTVDSVCVNVDLRGVIPTARPGPTSQRSHRVTGHVRASCPLPLRGARGRRARKA